MDLQLVTWAEYIKSMGVRNFYLSSGAFVGSLFPAPEYLFHSKFADLDESGNRWGFKNPKMDELCDAYPLEFDADKRNQILREIDGIVSNDVLMAYGWNAPYERMAYWNRFGMPESVLTREGDYRDVLGLWWFDQEKAKALEAAIASDAPMEVGTTDVDFFQVKAKK